MIDAKGNRTEYGYDAVGNNTVVRDALGNETRYEYDAANRRTAMIDALNHRTEYKYDDYDRLIETKFHDGTSKKTEYDNAGRKTAEIDQENNRTEFSYDSVGNLVQVKDPANGTGAMQFVTKYKYDVNNNRIEQTDANKHTTTMQYDKLNRLVSRTYPNGDQERFGFDMNGNMLYKANDAGDSTIYSYDSRNREILRKYKSGHEVFTHYTPDGKPDTVADYRGNTIYKYDNRGRQQSVINPDGSFIESYYDPQGNRTEQVTPWQTTRYSYDKLNRMDSVIANSTLSGAETSVTEYFYDAVGNRDSLHNANGTSTKYHYDNLNRLLSVVNYNQNGIMSSYSYELNKAGIRKAVTENNGSRVDFTYDPLYRLTNESRTGAHPYSISYTYDFVGNRLTQNKDGVLINYYYNNRDQLQTENSPQKSIVNEYDKAGRLTRKTENGVATVYSWIDDDRMSTVYSPTVNANYKYDAVGRKVSQTDAEGVHNYLIDAQLPYGQVIAETNSSGNPVVLYTYGLDRIDMTRNGITYTYNCDGQGSVRQLTNSNGEITDRYFYYAFGEDLAHTGTTRNEFKFVGEQYEPNSGYYYLRARYMEPSNGRFTTIDPYYGNSQSPMSLHRYLYANVCPITMSDPTGEFTIGEMMVAVVIQSILITNLSPTYGSNSKKSTVLREGFDGLWNNYPGTYSAAGVYELIGGKVNQNYLNNPNDFANSCALRMSRALNYSGHEISYQKGKTGSGDDKKWYYYRVADIIEYVTSIYGSPDLTNANRNDVWMKRGIILFQNCGWTNASGHIDLWNKAIAGNHAYWEECSKVSFWSFK